MSDNKTLWCAWLLMLGACSPPGADIPRIIGGTRIEGRARDVQSGLALAGAAVQLERDGALVAETVTDRDGRFAQEVDADQLFSVAVALPGYDAQRINVSTRAGETTRAELALRRAGAAIALDPTTLELGDEASSARFTLSNPTAVPLRWQAVAVEPWVTAVTPSEGVLQEGSVEVEVQIDRALVTDGFGRRSALLTLVSNAGSAVVDVRMGVRDPNAPQLDYDATVLDLGSSATEATLTVFNVGTGTLDVVLPSLPAWMLADPLSLSLGAGAQGTVRFTVDRSGALPGEQLEAFVSLESNTRLQIKPPVRVVARQPGTLAWSSDVTTLGFAPDVRSGALTLRNDGSVPFDWAATSDNPLVTVSPQGGRLQAQQEARVFVAAAPDAAGAITAALAFSAQGDTGALPAINVPVSMSISGSPVVEVSPSVRIVTTGRTDEGRLIINNAGSGSFAWILSAESPWLTIQGSTTGSAEGGAGSCEFQPPGCTTTGVGRTVRVLMHNLPPAPARQVVGSVRVSVPALGVVRDVPVFYDIPPMTWHPDINVAANPDYDTELRERFDAAMAFDLYRSRLVVHGGLVQGPSAPFGACHLRSWEYSVFSFAWSRSNTAATPPCVTTATGRMHDLSFDPARAVMILTGRASASLANTWEYREVSPGTFNWVNDGTQTPFGIDVPPVFVPADNALLAIGRLNSGSARRFLRKAAGAAWAEVAGSAGVPPMAITGANQALLFATPRTLVLQAATGARFLRQNDGTWRAEVAVAAVPLLGTESFLEAKRERLFRVGGYTTGSPSYTYSSGAVAVHTSVDEAPRSVSNLFVTSRSRAALAYDPYGRMAYLFGGLFSEPGDPSFTYLRYAQPFSVFTTDPPNETIFADAGPTLNPTNPSLSFSGAGDIETFTIRNGVDVGAGDLYWTAHPVPAGFTVTPSWGIEQAGAAATTVRVQMQGGAVDATLRLRVSREPNVGGPINIPLDVP